MNTEDNLNWVEDCLEQGLKYFRNSYQSQPKLLISKLLCEAAKKSGHLPLIKAVAKHTNLNSKSAALIYAIHENNPEPIAFLFQLLKKDPHERYRALSTAAFYKNDAIMLMLYKNLNQVDFEATMADLAKNNLTEAVHSYRSQHEKITLQETTVTVQHKRPRSRL